MKQEIRDLREKFFQVDNEYLNGYARLCGINATGVYLSMCRHADNNQKCFPSKKLIAEELSISERSVYNAIKELEKWNIISIENQGRKKDGSFKVKVYTLNNKRNWRPKTKKNDRRQMVPSARNDKSPQAPGAEEQYPSNNKTHIDETSSSGSTPFILDEELERLRQSKSRHLKVIAWYMKIEKLNYPDKETFNADIKRWVRDASFLSKYSDDQIRKAYKIAKEKYPDLWNLSTLKKIIPKIK